MNPVLLHLYVNTASGCNLCCSHCWVEPEVDTGFDTRLPKPDEFSTEDFNKILYEAKSLGLAAVKFTGGEPLMRSDFAELYSIAVNHDLTVDIETNGTIQPENLWKVLSKHPPRQVAVSLDSVNSKEHDRFRNTEGAWDRTYEFIRKLLKAEINFQIIMSVTDFSIERIREMAIFAEKNGANSLKINPVSPLGRGKNIARGEEKINDLLGYAKAIQNTFGRSVMICIPPAFKLLSRLKDFSFCPILNLLGILPNGDVSFCGIGFIHPELIIGNALTDGLKNIWKNSELLQKLRNNVPDKLEGICGNCIFRQSCKGQCIMETYSLRGNFTSPYRICDAAYKTGLFPKSRMIKTGG